MNLRTVPSYWRSLPMSFVFLLSLFFACNPRSVFSEETSITVQSEVNKGIITIGEIVQFTVTVRHKPGIRIIQPIEFPNSREFEVKSAEALPPTEKNGVVTESKRFAITAYGLGDFVIDEIPIGYLDETGQEQSTQTNRLYITVASVDKSGKPQADIRGLKKPWTLTSKIMKNILIGGIAFLAVILGALLWKILRRTGRTGTATDEVLLPHDEALRDLQRLFESSLIREGKVKQYYYRLSEILKHFLERRFLFQASEKTTEEIAKNLRSLEIDDMTRNSLREFLEEADIVKFAVYFPPPNEIMRINQAAVRLVQAMKPPAVEPLAVTAETERKTEAQ